MIINNFLHQDRRTNGCNNFYNHSSKKPKIIGITGTNGKTTISHLIYHMVRNQGISAGLISSLIISINDREYHGKIQTNDLKEIHTYINKMIEEKVEIIIMGIPAYIFENSITDKIKCDILVEANVSPAYLNLYQAIQGDSKSQNGFMNRVLGQGVGIINLDENKYFKFDSNNNEIPITYGLSAKAMVTASSIDMGYVTTFNFCLQETLTTLSGGQVEACEYPFEIQILGKHNIYNALAAITCGLLLDLPVENMAKFLGNFKGLQGRMEIVYRGQYTIIDDYCPNILSYETVFETMQGIQYKNLYIINAIGGKKAIVTNYEIAEILRQWHPILNIKNLIITAGYNYPDIPDPVDKGEKHIFFEVLGRNNISFQYLDRLDDSVSLMVNLLGKGDILLLLGTDRMDQAGKLCMWTVDRKKTLENIIGRLQLENFMPGP